MEPERYAERSGAGTAARTNDFGQPIGIDSEWPRLDAAFRTWLAPENFTADGGQRQSTITASHSTDIVAAESEHHHRTGHSTDIVAVVGS